MYLKAYPKTHLKICNKILLCYYCQDFQFQSFPTAIPEETPVIKKAAVSAGMPYSDANRSVTFLGLKEYKKIKGKTYTDTPEKNNKYLVLFLIFIY